MLYSIGVHESTNSVCWLNLMSPVAQWNSIKTLGVTDFSGHCLRDATVVKKQIVYFSSGKDKATYVLEPKEERGCLEVKSKFRAIDYKRGMFHNSSFCTYQEKIYYFPKNKFKTVWCLDVEAEHSSLYFSN